LPGKPVVCNGGAPGFMTNLYLSFFAVSALQTQSMSGLRGSSLKEVLSGTRRVAWALPLAMHWELLRDIHV